MVLQIWRLRAHCAQGDMNVCCFGCFCPLLLAAQTNQRAGLDSYPFCLAAGNECVISQFHKNDKVTPLRECEISQIF